MIMTMYDRIVGASDMQRLSRGLTSSALAATVKMANQAMAASAQPLWMPPMWKIRAQWRRMERGNEVWRRK
jgi:hypothetical protein